LEEDMQESFECPRNGRGAVVLAVLVIMGLILAVPVILISFLQRGLRQWLEL